jgi:hypothetical protein
MKNYTPHNVNLIGKDNFIIRTIPSVGIARISTTRKLDHYSEGVEIYSTQYGSITGLEDLVWADPEENIIVSRMVKDAIRHIYTDHDRFVVPDDLVRDSSGVILGCQSFSL